MCRIRNLRMRLMLVFSFFACSVTEGDLVEVLKMQSAQKQVCAEQNLTFFFLLPCCYKSGDNL